jgi:sucrose-phosphate synthase
LRDEGWAQHIDYYWNPRELRKLMNDLPGMKLQPNTQQREFKVSYEVVEPQTAPKLIEIRRRVSQAGLFAKLIYSHQKHIGLLPIRTSKGSANKPRMIYTAEIVPVFL